MAKAFTVGVSYETETNSLADSNGVSKAKTQKTVPMAQHRQKTIL